MVCIIFKFVEIKFCLILLYIFFLAVNSEPMSDEANSEINLIVVAVIANSLLILTGVVLFMCAESHCTKCCKRKTPENRYHEFENNYSTSPL